MSTASILLRPLKPDDLTLLHRWLSEPHLRPFYMRRDESLEQVEQKIRTRCALGHATHVLIALADGEPYGHCQWYLNRSYPDWAATLGRPDGVSIDYFIGEPSRLGKGLAAPMLRSLIDHASPVLAPRDRRFYIAHDDSNTIAKRATLAAGFKATAAFANTGLPSTLFMTTV